MEDVVKHCDHIHVQNTVRDTVRMTKLPELKDPSCCKLENRQIHIYPIYHDVYKLIIK